MVKYIHTLFIPIVHFLITIFITFNTFIYTTVQYFLESSREGFHETFIYLICYVEKTLLHEMYYILHVWIDIKRRKINYQKRMGLYRKQHNDEDEREDKLLPRLTFCRDDCNITLLCFYISTLLNLKVLQILSTDL